jgi:hypothetical protein
MELSWLKPPDRFSLMSKYFCNLCHSCNFIIIFVVPRMSVNDAGVSTLEEDPLEVLRSLMGELGSIEVNSLPLPRGAPVINVTNVKVYSGGAGGGGVGSRSKPPPRSTRLPNQTRQYWINQAERRQQRGTRPRVRVPTQRSPTVSVVEAPVDPLEELFGISDTDMPIIEEPEDPVISADLDVAMREALDSQEMVPVLQDPIILDDPPTEYELAMIEAYEVSKEL